MTQRLTTREVSALFDICARMVFGAEASELSLLHVMRYMRVRAATAGLFWGMIHSGCVTHSVDLSWLPLFFRILGRLAAVWIMLLRLVKKGYRNGTYLNSCFSSLS
jgi:hypothetical protein